MLVIDTPGTNGDSIDAIGGLAESSNLCKSAKIRQEHIATIGGEWYDPLDQRRGWWQG